VSTDLLEEHITSIFRVEKISSARNQDGSRWQANNAKDYYEEIKSQEGKQDGR
jgi:hypothetical protein